MTARDDDLVRWLRENGQARLTGSLPGRDLVAAADLIDRLRADNFRLHTFSDVITQAVVNFQ